MITTFASPKFILRDNLGKLARNLRFLGYDAAIYKQISLHNCERLASKEKRIILTRSKKEYRHIHNAKCRLIISSDSWEQLTEISDLISLNSDYLFSRCSKCNKLLYEIDKNKIISLIPEYVWQHHSDFRICRHCGNIYWQGDHYLNLKNKIQDLFEDAKI